LRYGGSQELVPKDLAILIGVNGVKNALNHIGREVGLQKGSQFFFRYVPVLLLVKLQKYFSLLANRFPAVRAIGNKQK